MKKEQEKSDPSMVAKMPAKQLAAQGTGVRAIGGRVGYTVHSLPTG
jgi:hypothetical protein